MNASQVKAIENAKRRSEVLKKVIGDTDFGEFDHRFKNEAIDLRKIHK